MQRLLTLVILFHFMAPAQATTLEIVSLCKELPLVVAEILPQPKESIGHFTVRTLKMLRVPFKGDETQISSILGTPEGSELFEIVSKEEMRAFGWCYEVDGIQPDVYPHEVTLDASAETVRWFFAYAEYKAGEWISMCQPAANLPWNSSALKQKYCRPDAE